jgi:hypothetical protein
MADLRFESESRTPLHPLEVKLSTVLFKLSEFHEKGIALKVIGNDTLRVMHRNSLIKVCLTRIHETFFYSMQDNVVPADQKYSIAKMIFDKRGLSPLPMTSIRPNAM